MQIHPRHPGRFLFEPADLEQGEPPEALLPFVDPLTTIVDWARRFLCRPHPELGRRGPVCPYVEASMHKCLFFLAVIPGADLLQQEVEQAILGFRDWFLDLPPHDGEPDAGLKTILVLFPDLPKEEVVELIDFTQERLKRQFVEHKLMVGEFHAGPPQKAGLWNPDFRPLAAPLSMLVVRHMVPTDFAFLRDDPQFLRAFLRFYRHQVPAHIRTEVRQAAARFGFYLPRPEDMESIHPRIAEALSQHGISPIVHRHGLMPVAPQRPQDMARLLDWPLSRITKSLFLRTRPEGSYTVVVCPVDRRVDLARLAERLGVRRLELATPQELSAWLGYSPGGVSPLGTDGIPVYLDDALLRYPSVLIAGGEVGVEIEMEPRDLLRLTGASVLSMTAPVEA